MNVERLKSSYVALNTLNICSCTGSDVDSEADTKPYFSPRIVRSEVEAKK